MFLLESLLSSANWRRRLLTRYKGAVSRTSAPCVQRQVLIALSENIRCLCHLRLSSSLAKRWEIEVLISRGHGLIVDSLCLSQFCLLIALVGLRFSQHLASVAYCSVSWLNWILCQRPLDSLRPLDMDGDVRKVSGLLLLKWPRAAVDFDSGAFVAFRCGVNR